MPSASLLSNMSNLVRDSYQPNGSMRSHLHPVASSQTSLQKLQAPSPQFLYTTTNLAQGPGVGPAGVGQPVGAGATVTGGATSQPPHMQFPPPPMAPQMHKAETQINPFNPLILPSQQQQAQQTINLDHATVVSQQSNGMPASMHQSQPTILMSPVMTSKNHQQQGKQLYQSHPLYQQQQQQQQHQLQHALQQHQQQQQQQQHQQQQQQQHQQMQLHQPSNSLPVEMNAQQVTQQVPMTTIMIPASAAAQIQSASVQIQQAAVQAMTANPGQPQILVFMIPYMVSPSGQQQQPQQHQHQHQLLHQQQTPIVTPTPEQASLNSTLMRPAASPQNSTTMIQRPMHTQQQQTSQHQPQPQVAGPSQPTRNVSSMSNPNTKQQEPESFYVKANFSFQANRNKRELSFQKGDILHVLDSLQNSEHVRQYWLATRVKLNGKDTDRGFIPDRNKAEQLALDQRALELGEPGGTLDASSTGSILSASVGRVNFLKRRAAQRSKSLCKDNWDNVVFDIGSFKLPVYERVVYKHPGFCRPVVIFGPLADVAREKLLKDYPEKYSYPSGFNQSIDHPKVIRLQGILEVIQQGKHALLDITPSAVEKLNYVNMAPIVIFMKTDSKSIIKEFRSRAAKSLDPNARDEDTLRRDGRSSRKLLEQSIKLEKIWYHVFTATLNLSTMGSEMWYRKLRETIENQQSANVWMSEKKSDKKQHQQNNHNQLNNNNNNHQYQQQQHQDQSNGLNSNEFMLAMQSTQSSISCMDNTSQLSERFGEHLTLASKSSIDLGPEGMRNTHMRSAYATSLAQKLARASSEPKLNGIGSENGRIHDEEDDDDDDDDIRNDHNNHRPHNNHDHNNHDERRDQHRLHPGLGPDDDDEDDDDDEIIKKPFPTEFENSSSVSSSNGATSYTGYSSMTGSNVQYQHYQPQLQAKSEQVLNRVPPEVIYSRNPMLGAGHSGYGQAGSSNGASGSNYHPLPQMGVDDGGAGAVNGSNANYHSLNHNQSMSNISANGSIGNSNGNNNNHNNNNYIELTRNADTRVGGFQVYSDMNQNSYHYYNINKL